MTNEEKLELAKKYLKEARYQAGESIYSGTDTELLALTSAIEEKYQKHVKDLQHIIEEENKDHIEQQEKYQAQIAMLCDTLLKVVPLVNKYEEQYNFEVLGKIGGEGSKLLELAHSLRFTQATSDAFIAEVKAGALEDGAQACIDSQAVTGTAKKYDTGNVARRNCAEILKSMAAELRNQDKQPCTCDGRCDGFCLEGKEKGK